MVERAAEALAMARRNLRDDWVNLFAQLATEKIEAGDTIAAMFIIEWLQGNDVSNLCCTSCWQPKPACACHLPPLPREHCAD